VLTAMLHGHGCASLITDLLLNHLALLQKLSLLATAFIYGAACASAMILRPRAAPPRLLRVAAASHRLCATPDPQGYARRLHLATATAQQERFGDSTFSLVAPSACL
jgi:hypothetical protein